MEPAEDINLISHSFNGVTLTLQDVERLDAILFKKRPEEVHEVWLGKLSEVWNVYILIKYNGIGSDKTPILWSRI